MHKPIRIDILTLLKHVLHCIYLFMKIYLYQFWKLAIPTAKSNYELMVVIKYFFDIGCGGI